MMMMMEKLIMVKVENDRVKKFKMNVKHFSHDHPLKKWREDKEEEADDKVCSICGVPILCSPSYTCTIGCKFFLHQECALKIPLNLIHSSHSNTIGIAKHILHLQKKSRTYECKSCEFRVHPLAAVPNVEIKTRHKSHSSHPLVVLCKQISCVCDVCGEKQDGFFFSCSQGCNFTIHSDCAILPSILMLPNNSQPFILAYPLPRHLMLKNCIICQEKLVSHNGIYFSPQSSTSSHIACAIKKSESLGTETRLELIKLPDDDPDRFPSLVVRKYAETWRKTIGPEKNDDDDDDVLTIEKYHNHPLIHVAMSEKKACCDLCTKPINIESPFYRCSLEKDCPFSAHCICVDILPILKFSMEGIGQKVRWRKFCKDLGSLWFNSIYHCFFCHRPSNGLCFQYQDDLWGIGFPLMIDLECMSAPRIISHASHPHHLLYRTVRYVGISDPLSCCPKNTFWYDVYKCIVCEFFIHISCAVLPKSVVYASYHHHNLHLVFPQNNNIDINDGRLCEVCEREIDLNYWLYGCAECDQWFHINCIPSVGYLSKVKFGGTLTHSHCHFDDHPLALTRMLTLPSQSCGCCRQIIQGMVDEMAFFCSHCHFWIHFSCAAPKDHPITIYSQVDDQSMCTRFGKYSLLYFLLQSVGN